ncbi:MAG TPA: DUF952 domain-containing protein [Alkalispirochaeta sp.]|nr:DUF952 domain-containing protein [Alkalispirochaeta sp.]
MHPTEPRAATYSIVAVDPEEHLMGVAVQSHAFSVGSLVPWGQAGVGVVATQSVVNVDFGPRGLRELEAGHSPAEAVDRLLAADENSAVRQVAVLTPDGESATHTGHRCIAAAGHIRGAGFSVQANMMDQTGVPEAMAHAWHQGSGDFALRLLGVLQAAQAAGGDIRGVQSAALLIVSTDRAESVVQGRPLELRVEDHPRPLEELERLITLHKAYRRSDAADELAAVGNHVAAQRGYAAAQELAPDREELRFWQAISSALEDSDETRAQSRAILSELGPIPGGRWWRLAVRLPATGLFPMDSERWNQLLAPDPQVVYHILAQPASDSDPGQDALRPPSLEIEGFVHCSFAHQLPDVLARHYPGIVDPPVMAVHTAELSNILVVEDSYGIGEGYPHLYGPIPQGSVYATAPLSELLPGILR